MTAETDLLPLPWIERYAVVGDIAYPVSSDPDGDYVAYDDHVTAMQSYTRANLAELQREVEGLRAEVAEARGLVTEANNSLYGSQSYFHSLDGGQYNKHHLANGIEDLKGRARAGHAAEARAERLAEALRDMLDEYGQLHAQFDLGECQATINARAALDQETTNG